MGMANSNKVERWREPQAETQMQRRVFLAQWLFRQNVVDQQGCIGDIGGKRRERQCEKVKQTEQQTASQA